MQGEKDEDGNGNGSGNGNGDGDGTVTEDQAKMRVRDNPLCGALGGFVRIDETGQDRAEIDNKWRRDQTRWHRTRAACATKLFRFRKGMQRSRRQERL